MHYFKGTQDNSHTFFSPINETEKVKSSVKSDRCYNKRKGNYLAYFWEDNINRVQGLPAEL